MGQQKFALNSGDILLSNTVLGRGYNSEVRLGYSISLQRYVAVKIIERSKLSLEEMTRLEQEVCCLQKLSGHPHIVQLLSTFSDEQFLCLVFEWIQGQDLLTFMRDRDRVSEDLLRELMKPFLHALLYCHSNGIVHLDVKLENVMLDHRTSSPVLIDFGFAAEFSNWVPFVNKRSGSPHYCAPEIVLNGGSYDGIKADVWSTGVMLYLLATGEFPFDDEEAEEGSEDLLVIVHKARNMQYKLPNYLSVALQDLLKRMLDPNPDTRITSFEVFQHHWFIHP